jgi:hypothetical protein
MKQSLYAMIAVMVVLLTGLMANSTSAMAADAPAATTTTGGKFSTKVFNPLQEDNEKIYTTAGTTLGRAYANIRTISYAVGALGIVGLGILCMFGKLNFQWLFMAIGGMAIIALIDQAMGFIGGTNFTGGGAGVATLTP